MGSDRSCQLRAIGLATEGVAAVLLRASISEVAEENTSRYSSRRIYLELCGIHSYAADNCSNYLDVFDFVWIYIVRIVSQDNEVR